jgi:hypothetical protein
MTTITVNLEEVYLRPTPNGWEFTSQEQTVPVPLMRVEIEADSRSEWNVAKIYLVDRHRIIGENRWEEIQQELEGKLFSDAMHFITYDEKILSDIQDKVDLEIIPPATSGPWPVREAGRTL